VTEPSFSRSPITLDGRRRDCEDRSSLLDAESAEVAKFYYPRLLRINFSEPVKGIVQLQKIHIVFLLDR
jgi:hypothetical protein